MSRCYGYKNGGLLLWLQGWWVGIKIVCQYYGYKDCWSVLCVGTESWFKEQPILFLYTVFKNSSLFRVYG